MADPSSLSSSSLATAEHQQQPQQVLRDKEDESPIPSPAQESAQESSNQHVGAAASALMMPIAEDPATTVFPLTAFPSEESLESAVEYPAVSIPVQRTAELRNVLKHVLLYRPKLKTIYEDPEHPKQRRILLLRRVDNDETAVSLDKQQQQQQLLQDPIFQDPVLQSLLVTPNAPAAAGACCATTYTVRFKYADFTVDEILKKTLPVSEIPSSFETVGHLAHVNLRNDVVPYKLWVGKVILDKHAPRIRTVVNKIGTIETAYRTFAMEVIAGKQDPGWSLVTVKEEGCSFELDFQQVYWNSRLGGEHKRLVNVIRKEAQQKFKSADNNSNNKTTIVADLMAGVGPFAIPLAKLNGVGGDDELLQVHANDLNPASYKYLCSNAIKNKCTPASLKCYNMDARAFVLHLIETRIEIDHVIMNLPASALEFLDCFRGWTSPKLPQIHVHCFCAKTSHDEALERCGQALGVTLDRTAVTIRIVRDVSPIKNMLCLSFTLPEQVRQVPRISILQHNQESSATGPPTEALPETPDAKRIRTE